MAEKGENFSDISLIPTSVSGSEAGLDMVIGSAQEEGWVTNNVNANVKCYSMISAASQSSTVKISYDNYVIITVHILGPQSSNVTRHEKSRLNCTHSYYCKYLIRH